MERLMQVLETAFSKMEINVGPFDEELKVKCSSGGAVAHTVILIGAGAAAGSSSATRVSSTGSVEGQDHSRRLAARTGQMQDCVCRSKDKQTGGKQANHHLGRDCGPMKEMARGHSFCEI